MFAALRLQTPSAYRKKSAIHLETFARDLATVFTLVFISVAVIKIIIFTIAICSMQQQQQSQTEISVRVK